MRSITAKYIAAVVITCAFIVYFKNTENNFAVQYDDVSPTPSEVSSSPQSVEQDDHQIEDLIAEIALSDNRLDEEIANLLRERKFRPARARLMQLASDAVDEGDKNRLGHVLSLLGQVAIEEQDLDNAEVYLLESLDVYKGLGDEVRSAHTYVQLGRLHAKERELARTAGSAYDQLLIARWQINKHQHIQAETNIHAVITENLSINRFGAAASAFDTLTDLYTAQNKSHQAETAAMEAAKLYAASGQIRRANSIAKELERNGMEPNRLIELIQDIEQQHQQFNNNIEQIERAKDYRRLYNHYAAKGNNERAWKLRVLASESLADVSKRAMYYRQPDVLAVLFDSNESMERAMGYTEQAGEIYNAYGLQDHATRAQNVSLEIY